MSDGPQQDALEKLRAELRRNIGTIVCIANGGEFHVLGTAFVVCRSNRIAMMLTAAHVLEEIIRIDEAHNTRRPNLDHLGPAKEQHYNFNRTHGFIICLDDLDREFMAPIVKAWVLGGVDIACVVVELPEHVADHKFLRERLSLDTRPVKVGERVMAIGYSEMSASNHASENEQGKFQVSVLYLFCAREGHVTSVDQNTPLSRKIGPAFQTDIPIDSGMSGGVVARLDQDRFPRICGILVSDDSDPTDMRRGTGKASQSAMIWAAAGIPIEIDIGNGLEKIRLLDLIRNGIIEDEGRAHERIEFASDGNEFSYVSN